MYINRIVVWFFLVGEVFVVILCFQDPRIYWHIHNGSQDEFPPNIVSACLSPYVDLRDLVVGDIYGANWRWYVLCADYCETKI
jgi:hypothetical protein